MINENIKDTNVEEIVEKDILATNKTAEDTQQTPKSQKTPEDYIKERREAKEKHNYNQGNEQLELKVKLEEMEKQLQKINTDNKVLRITNDIKTLYPNLKPVALETITSTILSKINLDENDIKDIVENQIRKNFTEVAPTPTVKTIQAQTGPEVAKKNEVDAVRKAMNEDLKKKFAKSNLKWSE